MRRRAVPPRSGRQVFFFGFAEHGLTRSQTNTEVKRYDYLTDHLGSVRTTVDDEDTVVHFDDYYPFGAQMPGRSMVEAAPQERYTGHELDTETSGVNGDGLTGLYYAGARYYDPVVPVWNSVDPMADAYPGVSPYNYVIGNPLRLSDPTGEYPDCHDERNCDDIYQEGSVVSNRFGEFRYQGNNQWEVVRIGGASLRGVSASAEQLASYPMTPMQDPGTISQWNPDFFDRWSESGNFFARTGYGFVDGLAVTGQMMLPFAFDEQRHINGSPVTTSNERVNAFIVSGSLAIGGVGATPTRVIQANSRGFGVLAGRPPLRIQLHTHHLNPIKGRGYPGTIQAWHMNVTNQGMYNVHVVFNPRHWRALSNNPFLPFRY